jgi:hypothetical protein
MAIWRIKENKKNKEGRRLTKEKNVPAGEY